MAKQIKLLSAKLESVKKKTTIGNSVRSRPKSKNAKRDYKKYRGQGK